MIVMNKLSLDTYVDAEKVFSIQGKVINEIVDVVQAFKKKVRDQKLKLIEQELEELKLRDRNPAAKDAWDQYQTIKTLIKNK